MSGARNVFSRIASLEFTQLYNFARLSAIELGAVVAKLWPEETDTVRHMDQSSVTKREMAQNPRWLQPLLIVSD
jgi:hypothetical protein